MKRLRPTLFYVTIVLVFISVICRAQNTSLLLNNYLNKIRNNRALLTAFFSQMPKGADLHNHFTGSIYAETYWNFAVKNNFYIDTISLRVFAANDNNKTSSSKQFASISSPQYEDLKQRVLQDWSAKDYYDALAPSDKHFFDAFGKFPYGDSLTNDGLRELKERAKAENVEYIELMFKSVPLPSFKANVNYDSLLLACENAKDTMQLKKILDAILLELNNNNINVYAKSFCNYLDSLHQVLKMDDGDFKMRYLTYANRTKQPFGFFAQLYAAFKASSSDSLIVGVNILSPEDNEISMRDYWLHMQMFKYCDLLFKHHVNYSMHAGELAEGLVKPEDLMFHIHDAVFVAGAKRIGHGVDMPYEKYCFATMKYMHDNNIAVEINLSSNEFILKVKDDAHPIMLYFKNKVPIVISSDDAGVLRSSITEQFVLLAYRYKEINYTDIKTFVYNSIRESFSSSGLKQQMLADLDKRFAVFETSIKKQFSTK